jgi:hypothetical protein
LWHALMVSALAVWLVVSTGVNAFRFDTQGTDVWPALKLFYFLLLIYVTRSYTAAHGPDYFIYGFLAGVLLVTLHELANATRTLLGLPQLLNPNVTGALLGLGVWFAGLGTLLTRRLVLNLVAAVIFSVLSISTFSKGAWLMCGLGLLMFALVAIARRKTQVRRRTKVLTVVIVVLILAPTAIVVRDNYGLIQDLLAIKLQTTVTGGSVNVRYDLAKAAVLAGLDNPVFGLGYRNFYQTPLLYPDLHLPTLERADNAHNIFAQTLAVGGFPSLLLLLAAFYLPLAMLRRKMPWRLKSATLRAAVWILSVMVWFTYGSVQLQLTAQPCFWLFCGLIFGLHKPVDSPRRSRSHARATSHSVPAPDPAGGRGRTGRVLAPAPP